ncbi:MULTISPECIES: hypothetical protein [Achromobacter]|uniref:hypothetical protein n=1 Tax=Achromobacter sp. TaxID=134375 RepID=UPI002F95CF49
MPSDLTKWIASIAFGLLAAWASFGVLGPVLQRMFGLADSTGLAYMAALDRMLITTSVVSLLTGVALVVTLVRIPNFRRLLGWGCAVLGVILLLTLAAALLEMEPGIFNPATGGKQAANDAYTALFFWALIFGLPYLVAGLALTIGGWVLIRRNPGPGAAKPA